VLLLSGCELYQSVEIEEWKPAGTPAVLTDPHPDPDGPGVRLVVLEKGQGPEIKPGSLVHASVTQVPDVRFWIGVSDLLFESEERLPGVAPIGHRIGLGDPGLRAAFIGLRSGSRVSLTLDPERPTTGLELPKNGFLLGFTKEQRDRVGFDSDYVIFMRHVEYELTIGDVCDATLLHRRGLLRQWGYKGPAVGGLPSYPFARRGVLRWVALDANCPATNRKVRFEKGPSYVYEGTLDVVWPESYEKAARRRRFWTRD
jgi:hypothetical protein